MLVIRDDQIKIFEKVLSFEYTILQHCKKHFPLPYEMLGEDQIRKIIQYGVTRAEKYGFDAYREKSLYISIMLLLGSDFDLDFQLPWAQKILDDHSIKTPPDRIDCLYKETLVYIKQVAGLQNEFLVRAMEKIREIKIQNLLQPSNVSLELEVYKLLSNIYSEKSKYQGSSLMEELVQNGIKNSKEYGLTSYRNIVVFTTMMFMLGSHFDDDLQFPWAYRTLNDKSVKDQNQKTQRLYKLAMMLLNRSMARIKNR
jgi:hypothetical protein